MTYWYVALLILILEGVLLTLVKKYVSDQSKLFATIATFAFVGFLFAVNIDEAKETLYHSFKNSHFAAWLTVLLLGLAILYQFASPDNTIVYLLRTWNKYTYNILLCMIILLVVVSTVLAQKV